MLFTRNIPNQNVREVENKLFKANDDSTCKIIVNKLRIQMIKNCKDENNLSKKISLS